MTPQELHQALNAQRKERGLTWWQVAVTLDVSIDGLSAIGRGIVSVALRQRVAAWLETADT